MANFANIFQSFLTDVFHLFNSSAFYYRPLLTISFIFDYQIGGISPFIYHFTNVALHILATCSLFIFLKKLDYRKDFAFLFSILFLVHPTLTQAVAWIPGRNDSLLAVFILPAFIFFIKYLRDEKISHLIWCLTFFGLALFTKESALFALPIMFFYLSFIYKGRKFSFNTFYFFIGSIGVVSLWAILRHLVLKDATTISLIDMIKSVYFNLPAVVQFVGKIFFPFNLSVLPIMQDTTFVYGIISTILLAIILFYTKTKRWNFILLGFGWFFVFLLPSFIRPNPALVADFIEHRLYVPLIGIFIVLLETDLIKKIDIKKRSTSIIVAGLILVLSIITIVHSRNFANRLAFWKNATQNSPHYPLAHRNLGAMEYLDGDMDNAEKEFKRALELNSNEQMAHNNLGLVYVSKGKLTEAENEYKKELEINPYYDDAYFNLGLLYFGQERYEDALSSWKKTLEINPNYIDALKALAIYYYDQKDYKEATLYAGELYKRGFQLPPVLLQLLQSATIK
ncbi:MAG: tetratricopeptide repeat protein [Candidatus Uhrbacteria bacterium]|nr:tetratricopeptide repeat protein [Candidatus Uhrbacteria bacterium]